MPIEIPRMKYFELRYRILWRTLHKLFNNPFRVWKQRRERAKYGVAAYDSISLYSYLEPILANGLEYLAGGLQSYPAEFVTEENAMENWEALVKKAAENARWLAEYEERSMELYESYYDSKLDGFNFVPSKHGSLMLAKRELPERDKAFRDEDNKLLNERERRKDELFDFLKKYFFTLWD